MSRLRRTLVTCFCALFTGAGVMWARQQARSATRRELQFEARLGCRALGQAAGQLPVTAGDEDTHHALPRRSPA